MFSEASTLSTPMWKKPAAVIAAASLILTGLVALQFANSTSATAGSKVSIDSKAINGYDKTFFINDARDIADSNVGDGNCATSEDLLGEKSCTLYAAIQEANKWTKDNPGKSVLITPAPKIRDTASGKMMETTSIYLNWGTGEDSPDATMKEAQNPYNVAPMVDGKDALKKIGGTVKGAFNDNKGATYLLDGSNITVDLQDRLQTTTNADGPTRVTFLLNGTNIKLRNASKITAGGAPLMVGQNANNCLLENITLNNDKVGGTTSPAETGVIVVGGANGTKFSNINIRNMFISSINFVKNDFAPSKTIDNTTIDTMYIRSNEPSFKWDKNYRAVTTTGDVTLNHLTITGSVARNMSSTDSLVSGYRAAIWFEDGTINDLDIINNRFVIDDVPSSYPPNPLSIMMKAKGSDWNISDNAFEWTDPRQHQSTGWDTWESWINVRPSAEVNKVTILNNDVNGLYGSGPAFWLDRGKVKELTVRKNTFINIGGESPINQGNDFETNNSKKRVINFLTNSNPRTPHPTDVRMDGNNVKFKLKKYEKTWYGYNPKYPITVDVYTGTTKEPVTAAKPWSQEGLFLQTYIGTLTINSADQLNNSTEFSLPYAGDMTGQRRIRVQTTDADGNSSQFSRASKPVSNPKPATPEIWIKRFGYTTDAADDSKAQPKETFRRFMNFEIFTSVPTKPSDVQNSIAFTNTQGNPHLVPVTEEYKERGIYGFVPMGMNMATGTAQRYRFAVECDDDCVVNPTIAADKFSQGDIDGTKLNLEANTTVPPANFVGDGVDDVDEAEGNTVTFKNPLQSSTVKTSAVITEGDIKPNKMASDYLKINIRNRYTQGASEGQVVYTPVHPLKLKIVPINADGEKDPEALVDPDPALADHPVTPAQKAKDLVVMTGISAENGFDKEAIMRTYTRDYTLGIDPVDNTVVDGTRHARYALDVESDDIEFRGLKLAASSNDGTRAVTAPIDVTIKDNDSPIKANSSSVTNPNDQVADEKATDTVTLTLKNGGTKVRTDDGGVEEVGPQPVSNARVTVTVPSEMKSGTNEAGASFTLISNNEGKASYSLSSSAAVKDQPVATQVQSLATGRALTPSEIDPWDPESTVTFVTKPVDVTKSYFEVDAGDKKAGIESHTLTVVLKDKDNGPIKGLASGLTATLSGLNGAEVGAFTESATTPGTYTASITSANEGEATVAVSVAEDEQTPAKKLSVKEGGSDKAAFVPGVKPVDASKSSFEVTPGDKAADGEAAHTVTIQLNDADGQPTAGRVNLTTMPGGPTFGTPTTGAKDGDGFTSDDNGRIVVPIVSEKAGTFTVQPTVEGKAVPKAQGDDKGDTATFVVGPVDAGESSVAITPKWKKSDGTDKHTLTVTLKDKKGNPITGKTAITDFGLANGTPEGVVYGTPVPKNNAPGVYEIPVTSTKDVLDVAQSVTVDGVTIGSVNLKFKKIDPPTVDKANKDGVSGSAPGTEQGSDVTVTYQGENGTTCTATGKTTDASGNFSVAWDPDCPPKDGGEVSVSVKDKGSELTSDPATTTADTTTPPTPTLNPTNGSAISGSAKSEKDKPLKKGSTVTVTVGQGANAVVIPDVPISDDGKWEVPADKIPATLKDGSPIVNGTPIKAEVVSPSGNVSDPAATSTIDKEAPAKPALDPTNGKTVTGKVTKADGETPEPGAKVTVTYTGTDNKQHTATGTTKDDGTFDITLSPQAKDGTEVSATATDKAGNTSEDSDPVKVDASQPAPTVDPVGKDRKVTGTALDNDGNKQKNGTVTVYGNDGKTPIGTGKTDENGNFTIDIPEDKMPADGENVFVTVTDELGNTSPKASAPVDLTSPDAPKVNPTNGETISGSTPTTGKGTATTVDVTIGEGEDAVVIPNVKVQPDGTWAIPNDTLKEKMGGTADPYKLPANTKISAIAKDDAGNTSTPGTTSVDGSSSLSVTKTLVKPTTEGGGATPFTGKVDKSEALDSTTPDVKTKSQVKLYKLVNGKPVEVPSTSTVDDNGNFTLTPQSPLDEDTDYYIQAKDPLGNLSTPVKVGVDGTPPDLDLPQKNDGKTLTGESEEGADVAVVKINGQPVDNCATTVSSGGVFTIEFGKGECPAVNNGDTVTVVVTDKAGNTTQKDSVVDTSKPTVTVDDIYTKATDDPAKKKLRGKVAEGTTLKVKLNNGDFVNVPSENFTNCTAGVCEWSMDLPDGWDTEGNDKGKITAIATKTVGGTDFEGVDYGVLRTKPMKPTTVDKSNGQVISGTAEPGSKVQLTKTDGTLMGDPVTVDKNGKWTVTLPEGKSFPEGTGVVKATATDGLRDPADGTGDVDTTSPNLTVPEVNNGKTITVTNVSEDTADIVVTDAQGNEIPGTASDKGNGTWTWTATDPNALDEGTVLKVSAKDEVGNTSASQDSTVDRTPPSITKVTTGTDETSPAVTSINGNDPVIVKTDQPKAKVTVTYQTETGTETITATADDTGKVTINFPDDKKPKDGSRVTIDAEDPVGNSTAAANPPTTKTLTVDNKVPADPSVVLDKENKNQVTGTVTGTTEKPLDPGTKVTVCVTKKGATEPTCTTVTVGDNGSYTVPLDDELADGDVVTAVATDPTGNTSATTTKTVDFTDPEDPTIEVSKANPSVVEGSGEPGSTVKVCVNGSTTCKEAVVDDDGRYSVTLDTPLQNGDTVTAQATDDAGNTSDTTTKQVDFTNPNTPTDLIANDKHVTGKVEDCKSGDKIIVKDASGRAIGDGILTAPGCTFDVSYYDGVKPKDEETLKVVVQDKDDPSKSSEGTTKADLQKPTKPTVGLTKGNANDTVTVTVTEDGGTLDVKYRDESGTLKDVPAANITGPTPVSGQDGVYEYKVKLPENVKEGTDTISATLTDKAGNTSDPGTGEVDRTNDTLTIDDGLGTSFSGTGEPGATVKVTYTGTDGKEHSVTAVVGEDGTFDTGDLPVPAAKNDNPGWPVESTDKAGNVATGNAIVREKQPVAVDVQPTNGKKVTVKVDPQKLDPTKPDSLKQIQVAYKDETGTQHKKVVPIDEFMKDEDGNVVIDLDPAAADGTLVVVTATDKYGNTGKDSEQVDAVAPAKPTITSATEKVLTGKIADSDDKSAEEGDTVKVYNKAGEVIGEGVVDENGEFTVNYKPGKAPKDKDMVTVTVTDKAGNESAKSDPIAIDGSAGLENPKVDDAGDTITGKADPGATIEVKDKAGKVIGTATADGDGNFTVALDRKLNVGETVEVSATDDTGHTDKMSVKYNPPKPAKPAVDGTDNDGTVTGTGEPGSVVTVCVNGGRCTDATVGPDGKFTVKIKGGLKPGDKITVYATNPVTGAKSGSINYFVKKLSSGKLIPVLALTGANTEIMLVLMLVLMLAGGGAIVLARRRREDA